METKAVCITLLAFMFCYAITEDVTVLTDVGSITGETENITFVDGTPLQITKFLGIPYAEAPVGSRRFQRPKAKSAFQNGFIAKTMSPVCIQNQAYLRMFVPNSDAVVQDEDCLSLNIFIPGNSTLDETQNHAVMIWFYGGDFQFGRQSSFNAKAFVGLNEVILVTVNYRVSLLGFLSEDENKLSGNYGLWDQHTAIEWVHDHIENFGGDPGKVTLFGQSAGAASAIYQALYDGNKELFQRVIAQSGTVISPWAYERNPKSVFLNFAEKSGCLSKNEQEIMKCFRELSVKDIMEIVEYEDTFRPVKDGEFVKVHPVDLFRGKTEEIWNTIRRLAKLDIILGVTSAEGGFNIPDIDALVTDSGEDVADGYSREAFLDIIVPHAITTGKFKPSKALREAIIHQYSDWADPYNEGTIIQKTVDLFSDIVFNAPVIKTAMVLSDMDKDRHLYFYVFDYKNLFSDPRYSGSAHSEDFPIILGFPPVFAARYAFENLTIPQYEIDLSKLLMKYWTNFAKTG